MIPEFTAEYSVFDNINIIVPAIRNGTTGPFVPSLSRECVRQCTGVWITCLRVCVRMTSHIQVAYVMLSVIGSGTSAWVPVHKT